MTARERAIRALVNGEKRHTRKLVNSQADQVARLSEAEYNALVSEVSETDPRAEWYYTSLRKHHAEQLRLGYAILRRAAWFAAFAAGLVGGGLVLLLN